MKKSTSIRLSIIGTSLALSILGMAAVTQAQNEACTPLTVVGTGSQTEVAKKVSIPGFLVNETNWNTDFSIPSDASFNRFVVTVTPSVGTTFDLAVNLKYSDDSVDPVYQENGATLPLGEPFVIEAAARSGQTPYQVNILVGGPNSVDNEYTASVMGCTE